jgi:integrase
MFRWGVGEGLVEPAQLHKLEAVRALSMRETEAPELAPVGSVDPAIVDRTLPYLKRSVADMVRVNHWTGMRPGEVCAMRWADIDTSDDIWVYRPRQHKNAHRGHDRQIHLGPKVQQILMPYRLREPLEAIFQPREADGPGRRSAAQRAFRTIYTTQAYGLAVRRACEDAGISPHWHPNQLRHLRATEIRAKFGLEAAGAVLGHSKLETSQIYAAKSSGLAKQIASST